MTLTMARIPLDSFLPSGAIHDHAEQPISTYAGLVERPPRSVISPLALPHATGHASYFDSDPLASLRSTGLTPTAGSAARPTSHPRQSRHHQQQKQKQQQIQDQQQQQLGRYLSPHRSPPNSQVQRSASLSPTRFQSLQGSLEAGSGVTSPSLTAYSDLASPEQTSLQLRRVTLQNRRLLENWEAERMHLEANRARAEEIYKEERAIMDEERLVWAEKEAQLCQRLRELEQENRNLREQLQRGETRSPRHDPAVSGMRGGSSGSAEKLSSSGSPSGADHLLTVKFQGTSGPTSPGSSVPGRTMPESQPFVPLDPRMQIASPQPSPGGAATPSEEQGPSIDIQEIHPELEGILLKPTAVQKTTFMDGQPSQDDANKIVSPSDSSVSSPSSKSKASPAEVTQEALKAPAQARLVMHAGHTPNHSLSLFPTVVSTKAPNTADSSGSTTPQQQSLEETQPEAPSQEAEHGNDSEDREVEAILEPSEEDRPLAEPMMLRNMPAKDEVFLKCLDDKLKESLEADDATPTVLSGAENAVPVTHPKASVNQTTEGATEGTSGPDAGEEDDSGVDDLGDVPLKLKKTANFGAPLGQAGPSNF